MRVLTGDEILAARERGLETSQQQAALAVLVLVEPERTLGDLARLSLGERNARLLELRAASLGRSLDAFAVCPECDAKLEFTLDVAELVRDLRARIRAPAQTIAGWRLRPANTLDLLAAAAAANEKEACDILLARALCRADVTPIGDEAGEAAAAKEWLSGQSQEIIESVLQSFERANAGAEIRLQFQCAACGVSAAVDIDVAGFLLEEISHEARRLIDDIHELASAYGWSEQSIVAMTPARRSAYLERLRQ
jgi:hypothetical protein